MVTQVQVWLPRIALPFVRIREVRRDAPTLDHRHSLLNSNHYVNTVSQGWQDPL